MSILPFWLPLKTTVALELILGLLTTIKLFYPLRQYVQIKLIYIPLLAFFIVSNFGVYFLMNFKEKILTIILGFLLIFYALSRMLNKKEIIIEPSKKNGIIAGSMSGLLGGMFNISGPPLAIYYLSVLDDVKEYNATIQLTFILTGIYTIFLHVGYRNINYQILKYLPSGVIGILIGAWVVSKIINKINKEKLNWGICIFMVITGFILVIKEII